jgi:hypothetical protein
LYGSNVSTERTAVMRRTPCIEGQALPPHHWR